ncbi:MAG: hypothetical protein ACI4O3_05695 [Oscillospiraceae bacterium]
MKKLVSLVLALVMCLSLAPLAMAAPTGDKTYTENTAISSSQRRPEQWRNMTVKAGATVTMTSSSYLEIYNSLTIEAGGALTGGQIWFFRQFPATISGMGLWYETTSGDLPFPAEVNLGDLWELTRGPVIVFKYKPSTGHYVYAESTHDSVFNSDLFKGSGANEGDKTFSAGITVVWPVTYNNMTVQPGAAVRLIDETGITVEKTLTVEPGALLTGGRLSFHKGASASGLTLYYTVNGAEKPLEGGVEAMFQTLGWEYAEFFYRPETGHYVLAQDFSGGDPFAPGPTVADERSVAIAEQLKALGLFKGVGTNADGSTNFDLDRTPTRVEAIVLLIRLLGKDAEAVAHPRNYSHDDVAEWAESYITYAFDTGLTNGVGGGVFGEGNATVEQFLTFVLRAMGYSDVNGEDFTWDAPVELAMSLGLIGGEGDLQNFNRGTCVRIMEAALRNSMKDGTTLADKLIEQGVFTREAYEAAVSG